MAKRLFLGIFFGLCVAASSYGRVVQEEPIQRVGTATTVSVSTSAWTLLPAASSLSRRIGYKVNNPAANNASVYCVGSVAAPTIATTTIPIEIQAGENPLVPMSESIDLYCVSVHTAAEDIHIQELGQ